MNNTAISEVSHLPYFERNSKTVQHVQNCEKQEPIYYFGKVTCPTLCVIERQISGNVPEFFNAVKTLTHDTDPEWFSRDFEDAMIEEFLVVYLLI